MTDFQLLDRARAANCDALQELACSGDYGARGYSRSREDMQQAATEGLHVARGTGDKKAQAFALYALVRIRLVQGGSTSMCQSNSLEGTRLFKDLGENKYAADLQLLMARSCILCSLDMKTATGLRHANEAFGMFEAEADRASALITQAELHLAANNVEGVLAAVAKATPLLQGDAAREASSMILCAKAQMLRKDFPEAEKAALSAADKAAANSGLVAAAKAVAAESLVARGLPQARDALEEALELSRGGDAMLEASLLHLLAKESLTSNPSQAVDYAEKAMTIFLLSCDTKNEAAATSTAAKANLEVKDYDAALQLAMQASQTANSFGDSVLEAHALHTAAQARLGKEQPGEALLAARKAAEIFHSIGDREGERTLAKAISKIQDKMPTPHRPANVLLLKDPMDSPTQVMSQARHCIVWNTPCNKGGVYPQYLLELLRIIDDLGKAASAVPLIVCSRGAFGRSLGCPVAGQQKTIESMSVFGIVRTARLEHPSMPICQVDLPTDADCSELARVICDATSGDVPLQGAGPRGEVAYSKVVGPGKELLEKMGRDTSGF